MTPENAAKKKQAVIDIQAAFLAADNLIRSMPEAWHNEFCDAALIWAIKSYLPMSQWFAGIYAYTVDESDRHVAGPVFIAHAKHSDLLESLMSAEITS